MPVKALGNKITFGIDFSTIYQLFKGRGKYKTVPHLLHLLQIDSLPPLTKVNTLGTIDMYSLEMFFFMS